MTHSERVNELLAPIEARANKATPGPWIASSVDGAFHGGNGYRLLGEIRFTHDAVFIHNARTDVPTINAELRAMAERCDKLEGLLEYAAHTLENVANILEDDDIDEETPDVRRHVIEMFQALGDQESAERVTTAMGGKEET